MCGNLIRGKEYGHVLSRLALSPCLEHLSLWFGGWGMRKQFGLQDLIALKCASHLKSLTMGLVGARITCDYFKKAMSGIAALPRLTTLTLDLAEECELGEKCHRGLALLRTAPMLSSFRLLVSTPSERLLSVSLGAISHICGLQTLYLCINHRFNRLNGFSHATEPYVFTAAHVDALRLTVGIRSVPDFGFRLQQNRPSHGTIHLQHAVTDDVARLLPLLQTGPRPRPGVWTGRSPHGGTLVRSVPVDTGAMCPV